MLYNATQVPQVYYYNGQRVELPPRFFVDPALVPVSSSNLVKENFADALKSAHRILVLRAFGLGDCLMLAPVIRELKNKLGTRAEWVLATLYPEFRGDVLDTVAPGVFDAYVPAYDVWRLNYDVGIYLDWYLERDHTDEEMRKYHRVDMLRMLFDLPIGKKPVWYEGDWALKDDYILVHEGGTRPMKSFSRQRFEALQQALDASYSVCGLPKDAPIAPQDFVYFIGAAKVLITFDTAPLWIAHYTKTPVICFLGASREEQRLVYHDLYPNKVKGINLGKEVGCTPCWEGMWNCNGRIRCMNDVPMERIYELVMEALGDINE